MERTVMFEDARTKLRLTYSGNVFGRWSAGSVSVPLLPGVELLVLMF
jgi:hypothetical protein